ncbi:hypothetical protein QZH56_00830 [Streptomyces olivoreticuli]|uniref:hypothetical protein n=1 Tax=Streptomyces olivoreticuli TaxID=68246 RepID=UPI00265AB409|nr:hypothetical protein [Streptomyces olivoreticuli]WKK24255.1 hypothetical protein QZH56_00830 [Streptomyces olivoreticuli]
MWTAIETVAKIFGTDMSGIIWVLNWAVAGAFSSGSGLCAASPWGRADGHPHRVRGDQPAAGTWLVDPAERPPLCDIPMLVGFVRPVWHYRRQTIADSIARSVVVYERKASAGQVAGDG